MVGNNHSFYSKRFTVSIAEFVERDQCIGIVWVFLQQVCAEELLYLP